jgi:hypothetical protein
VDVEGSFRAERGQSGKGGHGDDDVVADACGFDDGLAGLFIDELAAEMSDHRRGFRSRSGLDERPVRIHTHITECRGGRARPAASFDRKEDGLT